MSERTVGQQNIGKYYKEKINHKYELGERLYSSDSVISIRHGDRPPDPDPDFDASCTVESFTAEPLVARNGLGSDSI